MSGAGQQREGGLASHGDRGFTEARPPSELASLEAACGLAVKLHVKVGQAGAQGKRKTPRRVRLLLLLLLSHFNGVRLCATPWTAAHQALPSMRFSRQEYWSGVPLPSPISIHKPA